MLARPREPFSLTESAIRDLDEILSWTVDEFGPELAYQQRLDFFEAFERLAAFPGMGHRRMDLTAQPLHFFAVKPYLIVYQRDADPLLIHAVLHSARDVRLLLRSRPR